MIEGFENITEDISAADRPLVYIVLRNMKKYTKAKPIKSAEIVKRMHANGYPKFTDVKLRSIVAFIRRNSLLAIIATSSGYYSSTDRDEIQKQIRSLRQRANANNADAHGLEKILEPERKPLNVREESEQFKINY